MKDADGKQVGPTYNVVSGKPGFGDSFTGNEKRCAW